MKQKLAKYKTKKMNRQTIINQIKDQYDINKDIFDLLFNQIDGSLKIIESAENTMLYDSDLIRENPQKGAYKVPYGFTEDRFGTRIVHPGVKMKLDGEKSLIACLNKLKIDVDKTEKKKEAPKGLQAMILQANEARIEREKRMKIS
jgi:hypothetical protein